MKDLQYYIRNFSRSDGFLLLRSNSKNSFQIFIEPIDSLKLTLEPTTDPKIFLKEIGDFIDDSTYVGGYFAYEFLHALERIPFHKKINTRIPTVSLYKYKDAIQCQAEEVLPSEHVEHNSLQSSETQKDLYQTLIATIKESIRDGDVYQVNLSRQISSTKSLSPEAAISFLIQIPSARYGAYGTVHGQENFSYLSLSPELFFSRIGNKIRTEPIKGTANKSGEKQSDTYVLSDLLESPKDRAELAMIVDLYRNDLGKIALPGTVQVGRFPSSLETDSLFHLYCEISCLIPDTTSSFDVFCKLFPSGSITGAPKIAAMEHISALETIPRNIYCGAIGYFGPNNRSEWNVAIRTVTAFHDKLDYRTGGGITIDSDEGKEFQETVDKSKIFLKLINSL